MVRMVSEAKSSSGASSGVHTRETVTAQDIGKVIKNARLSKHWKQAGLAAELGIKSEAYIAHIESGRSVPSLSLSLRLEATLGLPSGAISQLVLKLRLKEHLAAMLKDASELGIDAHVQLLFKDMHTHRRH